jgi:hypothetical protein
LKRFYGLSVCISQQKFISGWPLDQRKGASVYSLGGDEAKLPATPTDIGVLPVPTEARINLPVVTGNPAETVC